jgi:hypothetical protein
LPDLALRRIWNPMRMCWNFFAGKSVSFLRGASPMTKTILAVCLFGAALAAAATPAYADRDAVHFFSDIRIAPDTSVHDAICFFCSVHNEGEVQGDIVVFFGSVHIAGKADHDVVNFFGSVSADDNAEIGNDLVSFFGFIRLGQSVSVGKDMVSMFGFVHSPESVSVGHDRVTMPFIIVIAPLIFIGLVVILIVHQVRVYRRRQFLGAYNFPPRA